MPSADCDTSTRGRGSALRSASTTRRVESRVADALLSLVGPALVDRRAGEVDHPVASGQLDRVPAHRVHAGRLGIARYGDHLVAAFAQLPYDLAADRAGCPGDGDAHLGGHAELS